MFVENRTTAENVQDFLEKYHAQYAELDSEKAASFVTRKQTEFHVDGLIIISENQSKTGKQVIYFGNDEQYANFIKDQIASMSIDLEAIRAKKKKPARIVQWIARQDEYIKKLNTILEDLEKISK